MQVLGNESVLHAIKECPCVVKVWSHVWNFFINDETFVQNEVQCVDDLDSSQLADWTRLGLITAWAVWSARNKELYEEVTMRPIDTAIFAFSYLKEFGRSTLAASIVPPKEKPRWSPSIDATIKINFDGAVSVGGGFSGYGIVARDSAGQVLGACAGRIPYVADAFVAESFAAVRALSWAREMGFGGIIVEGDALSIIRKLNSPNLDFSPVGAYIEEAKSLSVLFRRCCFQYINRNGNLVAHVLAQHSLSLGEEIVWVDDVPS
ncbi:hypothetical protein COLO4_10225 [Corchorus olitorius]|uniref:RNase H type-1 domain-containing protein n=1 Tax=Corchorus olitorius TaxID=93759 RepID=A0A1R3K9I2_9ROSI|nr:hypothetical protein COLO4_10225 [Corchorus olitorius]